MPELPEVARTAIGLNRILEGKSLVEIKVLSGRYSRHGNPPGLDEFRKEMPMKINRVDFYGRVTHWVPQLQK
jgi:formamidopyrimidine-DNA glycosylase